MLKRKLQRLIRVYTCQITTLLEITCHGSFFNYFSWTDMTPVDYTNWNANEPNDFFGGERCVEFYSHSMIKTRL